MNDLDKRDLLQRLEIASINSEELVFLLRTVPEDLDTIAAHIPDNTIERDCILARDSMKNAITRAVTVQKEIGQLLEAATSILGNPGDSDHVANSLSEG